MREPFIKEACPMCQGRLVMGDMPKISYNSKRRKLLTVTCTACSAEVRLHAEDPCKGRVHSISPNHPVFARNVTTPPTGAA